jgi:hypothetical protein
MIANRINELTRINDFFTLPTHPNETPDYVEFQTKEEHVWPMEDSTESTTDQAGRRPNTRSMTRFKSKNQQREAPHSNSNNALQASYRHTNNVFNHQLQRVEETTMSPHTKGKYVAATTHLANQYDVPSFIPGSQWIETSYKAVHPDTGENMEYKHLLNSTKGHLWTECCAEEIGCLAQGYKCTAGTNTMHFIKINAIPAGQKATYLRLVVADRPNKENPRCV